MVTLRRLLTRHGFNIRRRRRRPGTTDPTSNDRAGSEEGPAQAATYTLSVSSRPKYSTFPTSRFPVEVPVQQRRPQSVAGVRPLLACRRAAGLRIQQLMLLLLPNPRPGCLLLMACKLSRMMLASTYSDSFLDLSLSGLNTRFNSIFPLLGFSLDFGMPRGA